MSTPGSGPTLRTMVLASDYPLFPVLSSFVFLFLWIAWIMTLFHVVGDIFRSRDLRGIAKAVWLLWVLVTPFLGVIVYLVVRGDQMTAPVMRARHADEAATVGYLGLRG